MTEFIHPNFVRVVRVGGEASEDRGMTLREYYIGQSFMGIMSAIMNFQREWTGQMTPDWVAEAAIKHADALMFRLERGDV